MIHPNTEVRHISDSIGYGVFATKDIPEGTIVYVKDTLEFVISPSDFLTHSLPVQEQIDKYSYIDEHGNKIVSWDFAKYVNHCCNCNTISTGYGFEIAIRDIKAGEQVTDEYGIFNLDREMSLECSQPGCRKVIRPDDFDNHYPAWDAKIKKSFVKFHSVEQPLMPFVEPNIKVELDQFFNDSSKYKSVYALRLKTNVVAK